MRFLRAFRSLKETHKRNTTPSLIVAYLTRSEITSRIAGKVCGVPVVGTFVSDLLFKYLQSGGFVKSKDRSQIL